MPTPPAAALFLLCPPSGNEAGDGTAQALETALLTSVWAAGWSAPQRIATLAELPLDGAAAAGDAPPAHLLALSTPAAWAALLQTVQPQAAPLPVPASLFGPSPEPLQAMQALLDAGLGGWWPQADWAPDALRAALACDLARWRLARAWQGRLDQLQARFDERKWVDRAKGALMNARGLSESEAFGLLRSASMHANLRLADLSKGVVEAAQWADAVNRAGQLRMLSQRVVKLLAQRLAGVDARAARGAQDEAAQRVEAILAHLRGLSRTPAAAMRWPSALDGAAQAWQALRETLDGAAQGLPGLRETLDQRLSAAQLRLADAQAEALLQAAEALTDALEADGARRALRIVNLCGRQRMRVQRVAKLALLQAQGVAPPDARLDTLLDEFQAALRELEDAPLSTPDIRADLARAADEWQHLLRGLRQLPQPEGLAGVAHSSDALLALFDGLTAAYEHSLQLIMG